VIFAGEESEEARFVTRRDWEYRFPGGVRAADLGASCSAPPPPPLGRIAADRGRMDMEVNFGPQERVLWPASILAGVLMSGAVSSPRLSSSYSSCSFGLSQL
jgi:hypothetical protein